METWKSALDARTDLDEYGSNKVGLFAIGLRFEVDDLASVATDSITDGFDDKKCDLVYIDRDERTAVVAQCYTASANKPAAPANKASDLNVAAGWLLSADIDRLPEALRPAAQELRDSLNDGSVDQLNFWYVHNLPESANVRSELQIVENTVEAALKRGFPGRRDIKVSALEVGDETFSDWYQDSLSPILVGEIFSLKVRNAFTLNTPDWDALVTVLPARFLWQTYRKHKLKLFSANVRDYLGSRRSDQNINFGIKQTAEAEPHNFWAYNNGLTVLVNDFSYEEHTGQLTISGMSIVNGAQTTGAVGSLTKAPSPSALVPVRLIKTPSLDVVYDVIRFNNSQNKVTASDFRSTDRIQKRLKEEIAKIPKAEYEGGRRGGHEDVIRRRANLMPSYTVGQAVAAVHGDAVVAYNQKSDIWSSDTLYSNYFNDQTTASHLVFCYSLLRAVEETKANLVQRSKTKENGLTGIEQRQLDFFRNRGSIFLFVAGIAGCLESLTKRRISNVFRVSFGTMSPAQSQAHWREVINAVVPLSSHLEEAFSDGLKNAERVRKAVQTFQELVEVTASANRKIYQNFATKVHIVA